MDLQDQLKNLFPNHNYKSSENIVKTNYKQKDELVCKYEKRKGKPITIIEGFLNVNEKEQKNIAKKLKMMLSVGGSVKNVAAINHYLSTFGSVKTTHGVHQGRLATSRLSQYCDRCAAWNFKANIIDSHESILLPPIGLRNVFDCNHIPLV